ncbi:MULTISPECIES: TIM barrel protein [Agrobacterium]|uniref:TIM barrel protein n=1 Tax=Agrobacterium TaxID=357 RepID=UPI00027D6297|nr:TIM barrel protein [Agrobacterium pusense]AUC13053.1 myo-inositol catabolism protein [Rhizobium sp. Y9]KIV66418.1 Sugar phosphate isomerase/epimerase [Rhizobium sp. UR51a]MBA8796702.1 sugar phosphate isomerase/epimerase [Agrobacterium sp. RC10-4-1]MDP9772570.1 sugar phosphate isomerase/epimerase [Rhizobium sp. SORGH_AS_0755]MBP2611864.1 sugar phosphate isomerase/epimerase [Agrobacterium pusense]
MSNLIGTGFNAGSDDGEFATLENDLRALADIGCDTVEIAATSLDVVAGGRIIEERADRLVSLARQFDFRYTVHGLVSSNFMDPVTCRYQIDAAKALAVLCDRIGAGILVQHGGALRADQIAERAEADHRERDALFELAEFCRPYGVRIALENIFTTEPGQYRQTPAEVAATVKAVGHDNVVALIDFSHAYLESTYRGLDFREQLRAMAPVAGHLHVHDSFGRPQGFYQPYFPQENTALGIGDLHMPLGWGDIEWESIFSELTFLPDTVLMMEIGRRYRAEQPASLETARRLMTLNAERTLLAAE